MTNLQIDFNIPLDQRINEFKNDPEKMKEVNDFLNELFDKAKAEAELKINSKNKNKFDSFSIQNGSRRIGAWGSRAKTSARTFATRVFTAICNCTNSVRNATNAAINRT